MAQLGLRANELIAGFSGGLVSALLMRNVSTAQALTSVIIGTIAANYLSQHASKMFATVGVPIDLGAASFLVGLTAMVICQAIIERARSWRPKLPGQRS